MAKSEIPPLHNLAKLEYTYKFLYFLRDLGIQSAHGAAVEVWVDYVNLQTDVISG